MIWATEGVGITLKESDLLGKFGSVLREIDKAVPDRNDAARASRLARTFDEFMIGRTFATQEEAIPAWRAYQRAANSDLGHGDDAINKAYNGWQAFRMIEDKWTIDISRAWIDGAVLRLASLSVGSSSTNSYPHRIFLSSMNHLPRSCLIPGHCTDFSRPSESQ